MLQVMQQISDHVRQQFLPAPVSYAQHPMAMRHCQSECTRRYSGLAANSQMHPTTHASSRHLSAHDAAIHVPIAHCHPAFTPDAAQNPWLHPQPCTPPPVQTAMSAMQLPEPQLHVYSQMHAHVQPQLGGQQHVAQAQTSTPGLLVCNMGSDSINTGYAGPAGHVQHVAPELGQWQSQHIQMSSMPHCQTDCNRCSVGLAPPTVLIPDVCHDYRPAADTQLQHQQQQQPYGSRPSFDLADAPQARLQADAASASPGTCSLQQQACGLAIGSHGGLLGAQQSLPVTTAPCSANEAGASGPELSLLHTSLQQQLHQGMQQQAFTSPMPEVGQSQHCKPAEQAVAGPSAQGPVVMPKASMGAYPSTPDFSVLLQAVQQGELATPPAADGAAALSGPTTNAEHQPAGYQAVAPITAAAPITAVQGTLLPWTHQVKRLPLAVDADLAADADLQHGSTTAQPLPLPCGSVLSVAAQTAATTAAETAAPLAAQTPLHQATAHSIVAAQPMLEGSGHLCLRQAAGTCTSPDASVNAAALPLGVASLGASPGLATSEGSFRFQAGLHVEAGMPSGVCCTPVLRSRGNKQPVVSGTLHLLLPVLCAALQSYHVPY